MDSMILATLCYVKRHGYTLMVHRKAVIGQKPNQSGDYSENNEKIKKDALSMNL